MVNVQNFTQNRYFEKLPYPQFGGLHIKDHKAASSFPDRLVLKHNKFLGDALYELPSGIIDKKSTGIGATELALQSPVDSIIVFPTRVLAQQKWRKGMLYVGSDYGDLRSPSDDQIISYHNTPRLYKRLIVISDSLPRLHRLIREELFEYFIVLDEFDMYQSERSYRSSFEDCLDLFFHFKEGCMVSATMRSSVDPRIKELPHYTIEKQNAISPNLHLISTKDPIICTVMRISQFEKSGLKILIALNNFNMIIEVIELLGKKDDCAILASEASRSKCSDGCNNYYQELNNGLLPNRINFCTSAYFQGVDIHENVTLIMVADSRHKGTLLSKEQIKQIMGRSRRGNMTASLIYQCGPIEKSPPGCNLVQAQSECNALNKTLQILQGSNFLDKCRSALLDVIGAPDSSLRYNGEVMISYLLYDNRRIKEEVRRAYLNQKALKNYLDEQDFVMTHEECTVVRTMKDSRKMRQLKGRIKKKQRSDFEAFIEQVRSGDTSSAQKDFPQFTESYQGINTYIHTDDEICRLLEIAFRTSFDARHINKLILNLKYMSLVNDFLRLNIELAFTVGQSYSPKQIFQVLSRPEIKSAIKKSFGQNIDSSTRAVRYLGSIADIKRLSTRGSDGSPYKILNFNPYKIDESQLVKKVGYQYGVF